MSTVTADDALKALELYGQHHPDCAALWPEKPCDCGLSQFFDKAPPTIDMHRMVEDDEPRIKSWPNLRDPAKAKHGRPKPIRDLRFEGSDEPLILDPLSRECVACHRKFDQERQPKGCFEKCPDCRAGKTPLTRQCASCGEPFDQPRKAGRPLARCPDCRRR